MATNTVNQQEHVQTLTPSQWIKFIILSFILSGILLLTAWDLAWWQGWVYAIMLFVFTVGGRYWAGVKNPGLLAERANAEHADNVKEWDKILSPLMAFSQVLSVLPVAGFDHRYAWLTVVGLILVFLGYAFSTWAMLENRFFSGLIRVQTDRGHTVCDTGPYRMLRHPGYAGTLLSLPGVVLTLGSLWTIIPVIIALSITVLRTTLEDRALQEELVGYREYTERTRYRLIPGIY